MSEQNSPEQCRNCGADLHGVYCHECGQSSTVIRRPTREVLDDALGNVFHWDSRLLRTLKLLFLHPGRLSAEWVSGRRMRYVPPFRLYIIASFILFLLVGINARQGTSEMQVLTPSEDSLAELRQSVEEAREEGDWLNGIVLQAALQAIEDPSGFVGKITANLPKAAFLFLPVFALLHMLAYLRQDRFYIDYLVFSLNFHAFSFSLIALVLLAGLLSSAAGNFLELLYLLIPVYGIIAFRNFSQQGWGKSILKGILVFGAYAALLCVGIAFYFAAILFL